MDPPDDRHVFDIELKPADPSSTFDDPIGMSVEYLDEREEVVTDEEQINESNHLEFSIRSELTEELIEGGEATITIPSGIRYITLTLDKED